MRRRPVDVPPVVNLADSIREVRRIYKDYSDVQFARWYGTRYGVRPEAVLAVIRADKRGTKHVEEGK